MTALLAVVFSALGVVALTAGGLVYALRLLGRAQKDYKGANEGLKGEIRTSLDFQRQVNEWKHAHEEVSKMLGLKNSELANEIHARRRAEKQRDEFLAELAKGGDVKAVAVSINKELQALAALGQPR